MKNNKNGQMANDRDWETEAPMFLAYLASPFQNPGALENLFNQFTTDIAGAPYCVRTLVIA